MSNQTPGEDQAQVNSVPWTNGKGLVTGATIMALLTAIIGTFYLYGPLSGTNVWTGTNAFNGAITFGDPSSARANLGAAAADGSSPFTATGASSLAAITDRATFKGVSFDARSDFGLACDGATDDTTKFAAMVAQVNSIAKPVRLIFPGTCMIAPAAYVFTNSVNFSGLNGAGLKLIAGSTLSATLFSWTATGSVTIDDFTLDLNGATPVAVTPRKTFAAMQFNGVDLTVSGSQIINGGAPTAGTGLLLIAGYDLPSCDIHNNTLAFVAPSIYANQIINLGAGSANTGTNNCKIYANKGVNSGIEYVKGTNFDIFGNNITGVAYGACVGSGSGFNTAVTVVGKIHDNICTNTGTTVDENSTWIDGVQSWDNGVDIYNETVDATCGPGIYSGGRANIFNNHITRSGTCPGANVFRASAIALITSANTSAAGSSIHGNTGGSDGVTQYGVSDTSAVGPYSIGPNAIQGAQGAYNILGQGTFTNPVTDNDILNPCFQEDQRHEGAVQSVNGGGAGSPLWAADQWHYVASNTGLTFQITNAARSVRRCQYAEDVAVATVRSPAAADVYQLYQNIPISSLGDLSYGTNGAKTILVGWCLRTGQTAPLTLPWALLNTAANTSYTGTFTFNPTGAVEQCFSFLVPGDPANFITGSPTAAGLKLVFDLGSGTNSQTTIINQWQSGKFTTTPTAHGLVTGTVGDAELFSDVRVQVVSADSGWMPPTLTQMQQGVFPYYRKSFAPGTAPANNAGTTNAICAYGQPSPIIPFNPPMPTAPTVTTFNPSAANSNWRDTTTSSDLTAASPVIGTNGFLLGASTAPGALTDESCIHWTADAGL